MPRFTKVSIDTNRIEYLVSRQKYLAKKETLLNLFTVCDRPLFTFPDEVVGADLIEIEVDALHEAMPYLTANVFNVTGGRDVITGAIGEGNYAALESLVELNTEALQMDGSVIVTEIDRNLILTALQGTFDFKVGDICEHAPHISEPHRESRLYIVSSIRKLRHGRDHPYKLLNDEDTRDYTYYTVAALIPYLDGTTATASKEFSTYAVHMTQIPEGDDPRRGPVRLVCIKLSDDSTKAPFHIYDTFDLHPGMISNYTNKEVVVTTVGLFLLNATILSNIFGASIPYVNSTPGTSAFKPGAIDDMVDALLKSGGATKEQYDQYMKVGYFIGHLTHLFVPGLSARAMTTDPAIKKKAKELYAKHADELDDPVVVSKIEKELVAMDKSYMEGDNAARYYAVSPSSAYNEYRKKLYITNGLAPAFTTGTAKYVVTERSMSDGMLASDMVNVSNEIRRGVYNRGVSTAKGGEQTKFILRLFNATVITEDDCGSTKGNIFRLTASNIDDYTGRYIVNNGVTVQLTDDMSDYVGKEVVMRSPQHCSTSNGLCYTCSGEAFRALKIKSIGLNAVHIGSKLMYINMKAMHFSGVSYATITDLKPYLLF